MVTTGTNLFYDITEFKNPNKTDLQVFKGVSLQTMCVKFCLNVGNYCILGFNNVWNGSRNVGLKG